jgi:hypothetical protein
VFVFTESDPRIEAKETSFLFFAVGAVGEVRCLSGGILWIQQAAC